MVWTDAKTGESKEIEGSYKTYTWMRARDVDPSYTLFADEGISVKDPLQTVLGDCYFISAMSAVAEYPDRIKKIFLTQTYNEEGIIAVKLNVRGRPFTVVIDDYLPWNKT